MAKDKDGRPILTDHDWKTDNDRKKESPAVTIWGAIWRALLLLALIPIVCWAVTYWPLTQDESEHDFYQSVQISVQIFGPILGVIGLPLFGVFVYCFYFHGQCSKCKRRKATEETGATRITGKGFWSSGTDEYEISCKYCNHREWVKVQRDTGGGGG